MKTEKKFFKNFKNDIDAKVHKVTDKTGTIAKFSLSCVKKEEKISKKL